MNLAILNLWPRRTLRGAALGWLVGSLGAVLCARAEPVPSGAEFAANAAKQYGETRKRFEADPANHEAAWHFARACYDLADFATNRAQRAELAQRGIDACRKAIPSATTNGAALHYYLGMNLAQLAQTKGLGALKIVRQMEQEFKRVAELDEHFDYAGADRNLGLLYRDAPSFGSIGSRTKAREHLRRAVELAANYPENRLNLLEAYLKWGDQEGARRELKALDALWDRARGELTGPAWASGWLDWQNRLDKARKHLQDSP